MGWELMVAALLGYLVVGAMAGMAVVRLVLDDVEVEEQIFAMFSCVTLWPAIVVLTVLIAVLAGLVWLAGWGNR